MRITGSTLRRLIIIVAGAIIGCGGGQLIAPGIGIRLVFTPFTVLVAPGTVDTSGEGTIIIADFDQDGDLDAASAFASDHAVILHAQTAVGQFSNTIIATGFGPIRSLATADLDGSPQDDIVAAGDTGNLVLLLAPAFAGSGSTIWTASVFTNPTAVTGWRDVKIAELNGQAGREVVATSPTESIVVLWQAPSTVRSAADFTPAVIANTAGQSFERLAIAEIDSDGDPDIVAVGPALGAGLAWLENPGGANVGNPWTVRQIATRTGLTRLIARDFDRDGDTDIACTDRAAGRVFWYENPGSPRNSAWTEHLLADLAPAAPDALGAADLNQDGILDLLIGTDGPTGQILWATARSNARQPWQTQQIRQTTGEVGELPADDIDGLSKIDIITTIAGSPAPVEFLQQN